MKAKRFKWLAGVAAIAVIAGVLILLIKPPTPDPIISGKPVSHWLETLPPGSDILDPDHPLELAGPEIIPALIDALSMETGKRFYLRFYEKTPEPVRRILPKARLKNNSARVTAAFRLGQFGDEAKAAVPALALVCRSAETSGWEKSRSAQALGWIGPAAKEARPALAGLLTNSDSFVRQCAIQSLLEIGPMPAEAEGALKTLVNDANPWTKGAATVALWSLQLQADATKVHQNLFNGDSQLKQSTAIAIGYTKNIRDEVAGWLREMLSDKDPFARQAAGIALSRIRRNETAEYLPALIEGVANSDLQLVIYCERTLGAMGRDAAPALPSLRNLTNAYGTVVRRAANSAIRQIESEGKGR